MAHSTSTVAQALSELCPGSNEPALATAPAADPIPADAPVNGRTDPIAQLAHAPVTKSQAVAAFHAGSVIVAPVTAAV